FHAEDGLRGFHVTGVQTCALPIFVLVDAESGDVVGEGAAASWDHVRDLMAAAMADAGYSRGKRDTVARSLRTEAHLDAAGIRPGDPSLYRNPHGDSQ